MSFDMFTEMSTKTNVIVWHFTEQRLINYFQDIEELQRLIKSLEITNLL